MTDVGNINKQVIFLIRYLVFFKYYELLCYFKYLIPPKGGGSLKGALQTELAFQIKVDSVEIFRGSISAVRLKKLSLMNLTS